MTITLNADYDVTLNTALLGYVGETNARPVSVEGLTVDGADQGGTYVFKVYYLIVGKNAEGGSIVG